ncbi:MAG: DNA cytosine methyltransferase [Coriobacteriales bacterium]|jgi:DNA (cytosine-5)-methyltransferase 1|nr:DNA cytosine methyltransferase [Coriobacteriales bacterium]
MGKACDKQRSVISFFSGAMGLDLGLLHAGLNVVIGQDIESDCVETARANGQECIKADIRELDASDMLAAAKLNPEEAFLVCGGPPCQPFSTAGKRLGINDPRGSLFMDYVRMIAEIRPRFFIMENVKGLMSSRLTPDKDKGTVLKVVLREFKKLGYKTVHGIVDAVDYGVPQFRERFVLIGSRDAEDIFLPLPTHFQQHQDFDNRWLTLRQAIADLENNPGPCETFSPERLRFLRMVPEGGNWRDLPTRLQEEAMGGAYHSGGGKVGFYRRLSYAQPAPTLVTSPVQKASMLCHPTQDRPLSVKEYARIQQFPDSWIFTGTTSSQYRQIGNAVPVALGEALGKMLVAVAEGRAKVETKRVRAARLTRTARTLQRCS